MLLAHFIVKDGLVGLHLLLVTGQFSRNEFVLVGVLTLLRFELLIFGNELLVSRQDIDELAEFIRIGFLNFFKEFFIFLHRLNFLLNFSCFSFENFKLLILLPDFFV